MSGHVKGHWFICAEMGKGRLSIVDYFSLLTNVGDEQTCLLIIFLFLFPYPTPYTVTRETAFIQALLSGAAARTIGQACKDEDRTLKNCTCKQEGLSGKDAEGNFIVYECSANPKSGNKLMEKFVFPPDSDPTEGSLETQIEGHNNMFGIDVSDCSTSRDSSPRGGNERTASSILA